MLITLLPHYYWWYSIDVLYISLNAYYLITLLPYYLITIGDIIWLCENISKCLLPYYRITLLLYWWYSIDVCAYLFKCLLPYYLITIGGIV